MLQRKVQGLNKLRSAYGLPPVPGMKGVNGQACLDGPNGGDDSDGSRFGIQNKDYNLLRRVSYEATSTYILAKLKLARAQEAAVAAAPSDATAQAAASEAVKAAKVIVDRALKAAKTARAA